MQSDRRVPTINTTDMRQQHRKRSYSNGNFRKRDRHDLICVVCHAPAMGYNFDQITCESCKAFFRRNALNNSNRLKCRAGINDCVITLETRKRCKYCRLKKCFNKGLRKEWIMSEEEKRTKKQKIEDNRRLRAISQSLSMLSKSSYSPLIVPDDKHSQFSFENCDDTFDEDSNEYKYFLQDNDRSLLTTIEEHYTQAVRLNISVIKGYDNPCLRNLNDFVDVLNEPAHISALRMITLLKLTQEFNSLHEDDRLVLVKHNLMAILVIHFCICTDINSGIFHEPNTPNDFCYHASELRNYSDAIYIRTIDLTDELQKLCCNDHLIMKLLILIIIFSKGADYTEPALIESQRVFHAQNVYIRLLWNYLNVRFGDDQTASLFSRLIFCCMKCHSIARETKETITKKDAPNKKFAPLMQSILQIS
ncbi:unnamed protein product [Rotaria socialis]|uniref:Uncharacterized protein n=2 Tax=Rotaria socialis TaxID=392032 RepID=A0A821FPT9_9BILA|nr:unnamed protein product [Rotaria socialis]CAF3444245.1 unnamed protein product [Rotaria socialis]CAF3592167.1 unnamed protein product [Rotaria socialis]CAF3636271.1 unnamed protein product [Rotaria socialis]CAF4208956.1 unnamed protein product [Rotaria socialis]